MLLPDYLILAALGVWAFTALRSLRRKKSCCGDCARCAAACRSRDDSGRL